MTKFKFGSWYWGLEKSWETSGNIKTFWTNIDISSQQNFTQLSPYKQKHQSKRKQVKNIDLKILRLSLANENESSDSLISKYESILHL